MSESTSSSLRSLSLTRAATLALPIGVALLASACVAVPRGPGGTPYTARLSGDTQAAAPATLSAEERKKLDALNANKALAQRIDAACAPLAQHPRVRHARRLGMIWAWDVDTTLPDFSRRYHQHAMARGLVLRPIGKTLYAMPPYVLDDEAVQCLASGALAALNATLQEEN